MEEYKGSCQQSKICYEKFKIINKRLEKGENNDDKRMEEITTISKAMVSIEGVVKRLEETVQVLAQKNNREEKPYWFSFVEKIVYIILGGLLGTQVL